MCRAKNCVHFREDTGDLCFFDAISVGGNQSACESACLAQDWCVGIQTNSSALSLPDTENCELLGDAECCDCDLAALAVTSRLPDGEFTITSRGCFDLNYAYVAPNRTTTNRHRSGFKGQGKGWVTSEIAAGE